MIKAVVFDLDGVILDSERLNFLYKKEMIEKEGYNISDEEIIKSFGLGKNELDEYYFNLVGNHEIYKRLSDYRKKKTIEYIKDNGMPYKLGALSILKYLKDNNILIGLATSSDKTLLENYSLYSDIFTYFDVIVTGSDVNNGKPNPDIYLKVLEDLKVEAKYVLAIEDSFNGIKAAYEAKIRTVYCKDLIQLSQEQMKYVNYSIIDLSWLKQIIEDDIISKEEK